MPRVILDEFREDFLEKSPDELWKEFLEECPKQSPDEFMEKFLDESVEEFFKEARSRMRRGIPELISGGISESILGEIPGGLPVAIPG